MAYVIHKDRETLAVWENTDYQRDEFDDPSDIYFAFEYYFDNKYEDGVSCFPVDMNLVHNPYDVLDAVITEIGAEYTSLRVDNFTYEEGRMEEAGFDINSFLVRHGLAETVLENMREELTRANYMEVIQSTEIEKLKYQVSVLNEVINELEQENNLLNEALKSAPKQSHIQSTIEHLKRKQREPRYVRIPEKEQAIDNAVLPNNEDKGEVRQLKFDVAPSNMRKKD